MARRKTERPDNYVDDHSSVCGGGVCDGGGQTKKIISRAERHRYSGVGVTVTTKVDCWWCAMVKRTKRGRSDMFARKAVKT